MSNHYHIFHDLTIAAPIADVFQAISDPRHLINWWPLKCSGVARIGEPFNFYFGPAYDWYGEVCAMQIPITFAIKMTNADKDWHGTSFGFDLVEQEKKVLVQFWHKNWTTRNHHFRRSSFCWALLLNGLKNYLEKGIIIPFEERE